MSTSLRLGSLLVLVAACSAQTPVDNPPAFEAQAASIRDITTAEALVDFDTIVNAFRSLYGAMDRKQQRYGFDFETLAAVTREFTVLEPRPGVVMPLGGKYTTARCDAIEIVDRVQDILGRERTPSRTATQPLPGAPPATEPFERWQEAMVPLLKQRGVDHIDEVRVDLNPAERSRMVELTGRRTVPQIFIGQTHVGGCDDLIALDQRGGLMPLLQA